jgi:hypothetical protein
MLVLLSFLYFGLACFDAWITRKRLIKYGPQVEGNEVIRSLSTKMGPELGVAIGVLLPSILITLVFVAGSWPIPLAVLTGYRIRMFVNQRQSIQFEREARRINTRNSGS